VALDNTYHIPAKSWTIPPYAKAAAIMRLGSVTFLAFMLMRLRMKVVRAKADNPNGAGLANFLDGPIGRELRIHFHRVPWTDLCTNPVEQHHRRPGTEEMDRSLQHGREDCRDCVEA
jgi:hypothetical protein